MIGWDRGATRLVAADWLDRWVADTAFVYRTGSLVNQCVAARAGMGLALLPCYLGDSMAGLVRAMPTLLPEIAGELWIVTHADLKATARVRAFFEHVGEGLARERDLFEGTRARLRYSSDLDGDGAPRREQGQADHPGSCASVRRSTLAAGARPERPPSTLAPTSAPRISRTMRPRST